MHLLKKYNIEISRLDLGQYDYSFEIGDGFFELFDQSLIDHGSLMTKISLEKKTSFISMVFDIRGTVLLTCDRSLDTYDFNLETSNKIVFKYGEEAKEISDEVEIVSFNIQTINVAQYIYEFISVAIPMKKLHPRYQNETSEDQLIFSSKDGDKGSSEIDPRWSKLKNLKNKA